MEKQIDLSEFWQRRSRKYGRAMEGVLCRSWPVCLNRYLHRWTWMKVRGVVENKSGMRVLDSGCGYGRLSAELLREFPKVSVYGVDISRNYVEIFNKDLGSKGKALVGDVRRLPFKDNYFDGEFVVTIFTHLKSEDDLRKAFSEMMRVIKPGGKFVVIERHPVGYAIVTVGGLAEKLKPGRGERIEGLVGFRIDLVKSLVRQNGGEVRGVVGMPLVTILLPFLMVLSLLSLGLVEMVLKLVLGVDERLGKLPLPSLYYAYSGIKLKNRGVNR